MPRSSPLPKFLPKLLAWVPGECYRNTMTAPPPIYHPLLSGHDSVVWPALPTPPAARVAAMLRQLDDSQWWTPEQHRAQQLRQATALLHHRSEEHTSELQSLMRISYAVFCLKKKNKQLT